MPIDTYKKPAASSSHHSARKPKYAKQRAVRRCAFVAAVEIIEDGDGAKIQARTSEIGMGGCYVDTFNPLREGTLVSMQILKDGAAFVARAKVVYSQQTFGMGLSFIDLTPHQRTTLENWLLEMIQEKQ